MIAVEIHSASAVMGPIAMAPASARRADHQGGHGRQPARPGPLSPAVTLPPRSGLADRRRRRERGARPAALRRHRGRGAGLRVFPGRPRHGRAGRGAFAGSDRGDRGDRLRPLGVRGVRLAGAGFYRLPGDRVLVTAIGCIYTLRGALIVPEAIMVHFMDRPSRSLVFSAMSFAIGIVHLVGIARRWSLLAEPEGSAISQPTET